MDDSVEGEYDRLPVPKRGETFVIKEDNFHPNAMPKFARDFFFPNYPDGKQIKRFFETIGKALTIWQLVEMGLLGIFRQAVLSEAPGAISAAFYAVHSFQTKLNLVDGAVSFRLEDHPAILKEWKKLQKRANEKAKRRNQFAHFATFIMTNEQNPNDQLVLEPHTEDFIGQKKFSSRIRVSEIEEITESFGKLAGDLSEFSRKFSEVSPS